MSTGKASDFKIYDEQFYGGWFEAMDQNTEAFNAASANAIQMVPRKVLGDYEKEAFLKSISNFITRRDTTSVSTATDLAMTMGEGISVKVNRKIGPIGQTLDAWRKVGKDQQEMSFQLGGMIAQEVMKDYANTAVLVAAAALDHVSTLTYDATAQSTPTLTPTHLASGLALRGDKAAEIVAWVMHSKSYFDLVKQAIADKIYNEAGMVVYGGSPGTLGRPVVVIDAPGLTDTLASQVNSTYNVLGLVAGGVVLVESEAREVVSQVITGLENLLFRVQGEYAFNLGVKGFQWDTSNGGANPTDAALGVSTNWDQVATSVKNCAGVRIVVS
jgi:hypothetical protein